MKETIWACIPESRAAFHVRPQVSNPSINGGKTRVNHWSLGIEIVNRQTQDNLDHFSEWQVEVTSQIVRYCWAKYPNLTDVVSHAKLDPARRSDPGSNFPWDVFKDLVLKTPVEKSILKTMNGVKDASKIKSSKEEICI
ncbi:MAG: N-acetylmuramoyl-L-alanine amidase [Bacteroidota bacterium]|nr:N-acetylmuramoyl-L-alanine amidase [Bacteroidota bacterium]